MQASKRAINERRARHYNHVDGVSLNLRIFWQFRIISMGNTIDLGCSAIDQRNSNNLGGTEFAIWSDSSEVWCLTRAKTSKMENDGNEKLSRPKFLSQPSHDQMVERSWVLCFAKHELFRMASEIGSICVLKIQLNGGKKYPDNGKALRKCQGKRLKVQRLSST